MRPDELDYLAVMGGRARVIPPSLVNHGEPLIAIRHFGGSAPAARARPAQPHRAGLRAPDRARHWRPASSACDASNASRVACFVPARRSPLGRNAHALCAFRRLVLFQAAFFVFLPATAGGTDRSGSSCSSCAAILPRHTLARYRVGRCADPLSAARWRARHSRGTLEPRV